jgi:sucrose-6-phosphate hydrolase SacC (GH32 family)
VLAGCGRYGDFALPRLAGERNITLRVRLDPQAVIERDGSSDVLNPSVVRLQSFLNLYSEFDGRTWHTALAESSDGRNWSKKGRVLSPDPTTWEGSYIAANGSALVENGKWWYWYQSGKGIPGIGLARSDDGLHWRKEPRPALEPGPRGSWDERGVADPYVLKLGSEYYVYYLGQNRARQQQIGVARSTDGLHWEKLLSNPVMEAPDSGNGIGEPAVWQWKGWYWMLYTARSKTEQRTLREARSLDGVHWEQLGEPIRGTENWDREVVCDPSVVLDGDSALLWFGGGDKPRPDEHLDGQIGFGIIETQP